MKGSQSDEHASNESLEYKRHPLVGTQINFVNLHRVEVFANHTVFIRGAANQILSIIRYGTDQDAKLFADLLMGFRGRYMQRHVVLQAQAAPPSKDRHLQRAGSGSGFVINVQGEVLTNAHVVRECLEACDDWTLGEKCVKHSCMGCVVTSTSS
jgi:S1-C subfamily serine protease